MTQEKIEVTEELLNEVFIEWIKDYQTSPNKFISMERLKSKDKPISIEEYSQGITESFIKRLKKKNIKN